jgi:hypothetical protein
MDNVQNCDSYMQRIVITQGFFSFWKGKQGSQSLNKIKKKKFSGIKEGQGRWPTYAVT